MRIARAWRESRIAGELELLAMVGRADVVDRENRVGAPLALEAEVVLVRIWVLEKRIEEPVALAKWIRSGSDRVVS